MKHLIDTNFYPGWTRKSISFTIDDGNLAMDKKFLDIVEPYGLRGTFNLCSDRLTKMSPEEYREFYRGYEIANHCKYHVSAFIDGVEFEFANEPFGEGGEGCDVPFDENTADKSKAYHDGKIKGLCYYTKWNGRWYTAAQDEDYKRFVLEGHRELEEIFGEGSIRCFAWPCGLQQNAELIDFVRNKLPGYYGAREGHSWGAGPEAFAIPENYMAYGLTTRHQGLLETAALYEALPDDGELKYFCFGVHSIDYERDDKWGDLLTFAKTYGARPKDYYYASTADIFDYADAVAALEIGDTMISNPSDKDIYIKIDGERRIIKAKRSISLD